MNLILALVFCTKLPLQALIYFIIFSDLLWRKNESLMNVFGNRVLLLSMKNVNEMRLSLCFFTDIFTRMQEKNSSKNVKSSHFLRLVGVFWQQLLFTMNSIYNKFLCLHKKNLNA